MPSPCAALTSAASFSNAFTASRSPRCAASATPVLAGWACNATERQSAPARLARAPDTNRVRTM